MTSGWECSRDDDASHFAALPDAVTVGTIRAGRPDRFVAAGCRFVAVIGDSRAAASVVHLSGVETARVGHLDTTGTGATRERDVCSWL